MEDWQIADGGAECRSLGGNRSIHSLTHQITHPAKGFTLSAHISRLEMRGKDAGAGFRVSVRSELNEYRRALTSNRRPAGQLGGSDDLSCPVRYLVEHLHMSGASELSHGVAADRAFPAAVAELVRPVHIVCLKVS